MVSPWYVVHQGEPLYGLSHLRGKSLLMKRKGIVLPSFETLRCFHREAGIYVKKESADMRRKDQWLPLRLKF